MQVSKRREKTDDLPNRRSFRRHDVQCRARIVIGTRHYAGYLHNISQGGAKLRTITPIGRIGHVLLKLPDLPPLRCRLRWSDSYNAGVAFDVVLEADTITGWLGTRSAIPLECHIARAEAFG